MAFSSLTSVLIFEGAISSELKNIHSLVHSLDLKLELISSLLSHGHVLLKDVVGEVIATISRGISLVQELRHYT